MSTKQTFGLYHGLLLAKDVHMSLYQRAIHNPVDILSYTDKYFLKDLKI